MLRHEELDAAVLEVALELPPGFRASVLLDALDRRENDQRLVDYGLRQRPNRRSLIAVSLRRLLRAGALTVECAPMNWRYTATPRG